MSKLQIPVNLSKLTQKQKTLTEDIICTSEEIANGNDRLRITLSPLQGEKILITNTVRQSLFLLHVLREVIMFSSFTSENDPYGEHDFGAVESAGTRYLFKIDYYDENLEFGVDQYRERFRRVLTIMCADEY